MLRIAIALCAAVAAWAAQFPARGGHASVTTSSGAIVALGGVNLCQDKLCGLNDVWSSTDSGSSWTQVTAAAPWARRALPAVVTTSSGSIVLLGGEAISESGSYEKRNDVWRSADSGRTWTQIPQTGAWWTPRADHAAVALTGSSILLMGGRDSESNDENDVWRTDNGGTTWRHVGNATWSSRSGHSAVKLASGAVLVMGGYYEDNSGPPEFIHNVYVYNDIWRTSDSGATWTRVVQNATWSGRHRAAAAVSGNAIVVVGGLGLSDRFALGDAFVSTDEGLTWRNIPSPYPARIAVSAVSLPSGAIVLTGGLNFAPGDSLVLYTDVWRSTDNGASWFGPTPAPASPLPPPSPASSSSTGLIVGIVVGVAVIGGAAAFMLWRKRQMGK